MAQEAQRDTAAPIGNAAAREGARDDSPRRWLILGVVCLAQLMVVLDATVVNIALPSAQHDLAFNNADRQWVVTAYSLAFGGLLLLGGRLSDLVGRKRMLILGIVGFALASALGGAAQNFTMLLIARAVQGAFGAMLAPAALSTLTVTFTNPAERGKAFGIFGAIAGAGGAVGLLLGGVLTEYLSWRWCLYVNVIFSVIAVAAAIRLLSRDQRDPNVHLDPPGTVLVVAGPGRLRLRAGRGRHQGVGRPADHRPAGGRGGPADPVRADGTAGGASAAAAADRPRPVQGRGLPCHRAVRDRLVRRFPVPHLLPGRDPALLAGGDRRGVPAADRRPDRVVDHVPASCSCPGSAPAS